MQESPNACSLENNDTILDTVGRNYLAGANSSSSENRSAMSGSIEQQGRTNSRRAIVTRHSRKASMWPQMKPRGMLPPWCQGQGGFDKRRVSCQKLWPTLVPVALVGREMRSC